MSELHNGDHFALKVVIQPNFEVLENLFSFREVSQNVMSHEDCVFVVVEIRVSCQSISLIIIRSMADQSSQNDSPNYEANVSTNSGVVVVGTAIIHHTTNGCTTPGI